MLELKPCADGFG